MGDSFEKIKSTILEMEPYDFENFVADVWESKGYDTTLRQKSRDKGIDIIANKPNEKVAIQVKRYAESNNIGSQEIRNYATLYQQDNSIDTVYVVTSSGFTKPSKTLARELDVKIINGDVLSEFAEKGDISISEYIPPKIEEMSDIERKAFERLDISAKKVGELTRNELKDNLEIDRQLREMNNSARRELENIREENRKMRKDLRELNK